MTVQYEQQEYEDYVKDYVDTQPERLPTPVAQSGYYLMEEDIDIFEDEETERIEVPRFDECRRSVVIHDFRMVSFPSFVSSPDFSLTLALSIPDMPC